LQILQKVFLKLYFIDIAAAIKVIKHWKTVVCNFDVIILSFIRTIKD